MTASTTKSELRVTKKQEKLSSNATKTDFLREDLKDMDEGIIEDFFGGILIFTEKKQLIYSNNGAQKILHQLQQESATSLVPDEIWHICHSLVQSRLLFPDQSWLIEFNIFTSKAITLHIRSRWVNVSILDPPCLVLTLEDRRQPLVNLVLEEAERYGLTPREKEVWTLQHNGYTYKQIAAELGITPNTVKKHMRSIHAKRRADQDE
jgi:DNA-binding CsgD family transcriptional regulator